MINELEAGRDPGDLRTHTGSRFRRPCRVCVMRATSSTSRVRAFRLPGRVRSPVGSGEPAGAGATAEGSRRSQAPISAEAAVSGSEPPVDLSAYLAAVPDEVVEPASRAAPGSRRSATRTRRPMRSARRWRSPARGSEWGSGHAGVRGPGAGDVRLHAGHGPLPHQPDPAVDYDLLVVGDCGELERVGPVLESHASLFERVPILDIDHHISNPRFGAVDWVDPTQLRHLRDGDAAGLADGRAARRRRTGCSPSALAAGVVMDTGNFQHPNVTPRTLVVAAALREAGAPLQRDRPAPLPHQAQHSARAFRPRAGPHGIGPGRPARLVHAGAGRPGRQRRGRGRVRGPDRPAGPGRDVRGRDPLQGGGRRRRASASERATAASTRRC